MSEMPEIPELKDSDFGWECPTCRTKIGKDFRPLSNCACGQPWVVLDAEGQRTAETFQVPVMSVAEMFGCLNKYPPTYDLAEFELHVSFRNKLKLLINTASMENGSDTPDFLLAEYLSDCLIIFDNAVTKRELWYGRKAKTVPVNDIPK